MHMIVVGCGRVGSTVARELSASGHDVVVVDRNAAAFRRLGNSFTGRTVVGIGFDREVLHASGIEHADAVVAVTSGDNSNVLVARVAREMFGVENVVARIYDPRRAAIYQRLGIATVATVAWTSSQILSFVAPDRGQSEWTDPTSKFVLVERRVPPQAAGRSVSEFADIGIRVVLLTRHGACDMPAGSTLIQEGDTLHLLGAPSSIHEYDTGRFERSHS